MSPGEAKLEGRGEGFVQAAWTADAKGNNPAQARPITTDALYIWKRIMFRRKGGVLRGRTQLQHTKTFEGK
jgi:hypothetical protein